MVAKSCFNFSITSCPALPYQQQLCDLFLLLIFLFIFLGISYVYAMNPFLYFFFLGSILRRRLSVLMKNFMRMCIQSF